MKKSIEKIWDALPIADRVKIADESGLSGRVGSSLWKDMPDIYRGKIKAHQAGIESGVYKVEMTAHKGEMRPRIVEGKHKGEIIDTPVSPTFTGKGLTVDKKVKTVTWREKTSEVGKMIEKHLEPKKAQDYLLWVGYQSYPTIKSFVEEAERLGVCRRINKVPSGVVLGKTRIFLAHDEGERGCGVIFGYFVPDKIEVIIHDEAENGLPEDLIGRADPIRLAEALKEDERGCGYRDEVGAVYLVTRLSGGLVQFKPCKDYNRLVSDSAQRFRGIKKVSGSKIMRGRGKRIPSDIYKIAATDKIKATRKTRWTDKELDTLRDLLTKSRPLQAIREMHKINGRSILAVSYQYNQMRKRGEI